MISNPFLNFFLFLPSDRHRNADMRGPPHPWEILLSLDHQTVQSRGQDRLRVGAGGRHAVVAHVFQALLDMQVGEKAKRLFEYFAKKIFGEEYLSENKSVAENFSLDSLCMNFSRVNILCQSIPPAELSKKLLDCGIRAK